MEEREEGKEGTLALEIQGLTTDGRGIARPEGKPVIFVDAALPGERVEARIRRKSSKLWEAELVEVLHASPDRVQPPCRYVPVCGGCRLQHLALPAQTRAKRAWLLETAARVGRWQPRHLELLAALVEVKALSAESYRTRIRLHASPDGRVGFHAARSNDIIEIDDCLVAAEPIRAALPGLRASAREQAPRFPELELTAQQDGTVAVHAPARDPRFGGDAFRGRDAKGQGTGRNSAASLHWTDATAQSGAPAALRWPHPRHPHFQVPLASFVQPHKDALEAYCGTLEAWFEAEAALWPASREIAYWDLYAGSGPFTYLGAHAWGRRCPVRSTAVEGIGPAIARVRLNWPELDIRAAASDVGTWLRAEGARLGRPDVVLLDPPRAGAGIEVMELIAALAETRSRALVAYVACDAASLARDGAVLLGRGWELARASLFDSFPHTPHYETILLFRWLGSTKA